MFRLSFALVAIAAVSGASPSQAVGQGVQAAAARSQEDARAELRAVRVERPPEIDGNLDDDVWRGEPLRLGEWTTYEPVFGEKAPFATDVWVGYDDRRLYVAFRCLDPEPSRLKTGIRRRDAIQADDGVAVYLDPQQTRQSLLMFSANPHGVQSDGTLTDLAPDWVWDSAARITREGYTVEMALPFESLNLSARGLVRLPVRFARAFPRVGTVASWPPTTPGRSEQDCAATLTIEGLRSHAVRDLIPTATYSAQQSRMTATSFAPTSSSGDLGLTVKHGLGRGTLLEATINPDFSQVESDAYQVEINQRYPVFYLEKRPFFMEGSDLLRLASVGHVPNLSAAVHTRRIADPTWGAKATGAAGKMAFAALAAGDAAPGVVVPAGERGAGADKLFVVGRLQWTLAPGSNAGAIVTDTEFAGRSNRAAGGDLSYRMTEHQRVKALALATVVRSPDGSSTTSGAVGVGHVYESRRWFSESGLEHYGRGFAMDTGFYNQVGFTRISNTSALYLYPASSWLRRTMTWVQLIGTRDRLAGGDSGRLAVGLSLTLAGQRSLGVTRYVEREAWQGRLFDRGRLSASTDLRVTNWLRVSASLTRGRGIYYQGSPPFPGKVRDFTGTVLFEPTKRLAERLDIQNAAFDRAGTRERVYGLWLLNSRTTYQLTRRLAARAIVQFDTSRDRVLLDTLGSYEVRPGTVFYAGYGSLLERRDFAGARPEPHDTDYMTTRRGVFVKASYLVRF